MNTYQPPATFSNLSPQQQDPNSKYPQLSPPNYPQAGVNPQMNYGHPYGVNPPPMSYGQAGVNPSINTSHEVVNPEIIQRRLALQKEISEINDSLNGPFGVFCRLWFICLALAAGFIVIASKGRFEFPSLLIFIVWIIVQSIVTFSNVGNKSVKTSRGLFVSMIIFSILYALFFLRAQRWNIDSVSLYIFACFSLVPSGVSLIFTILLKSKLEQRAELVRKLDEISAIHKV